MRNILLLCSLAFATPMLSVPLRVTYTGSVTSMTETLNGGPISVGDQVSGYYDYYPDGAVANISRWGPGDIYSETRFYVLGTHEINLGSETFRWVGAADNSNIRTSPNTPGETAYTVHMAPNDFTYGSITGINDLPVNSVSVSWANFPYVIAEDTIPEVLPPFDAISNPAHAFVSFTPLGNDTITVTLASASISSVPDTGSTAALLGAGVAALAFARRRLGY
ncbi:VPDSG-CTERM sorting domain-containing protein [Candidatus Pelagisphaera phototrophica]|uniref:VPDSG-CTERM sorting domain-containing protein n=1 Tax=Candidatus Pelagisphaera phototrophica TaxID=2684113 RepID=UPI0019E378F3|nr:VPDSG-CTERM sorting domain-containing protein [Candidatus Pelagisphaera phototrophica]QXD33698.1 VPDSG-CTERM sorting domain-containing protein [Candidatus Pelagisphaera phototrophica]